MIMVETQVMQKNIISYKIRVEHKYKTILSYFEPIAEEIVSILCPKKNNSGGCLVF